MRHENDIDVDIVPADRKILAPIRSMLSIANFALCYSADLAQQHDYVVASIVAALEQRGETTGGWQPIVLAGPPAQLRPPLQYGHHACYGESE